MSFRLGAGDADMVAVVPVRDGVLPLGALETIAECGGSTLLAGSEPDARAVAGVGRDVRCIHLGTFQPGRWAVAISRHVADTPVVVLPASPDGRDLAPRLAHVLDRPLLAGAIAVTPAHASLARSGGLSLHEFTIDGPVVATLQPGVRGVLVDDTPALRVVRRLDGGRREVLDVRPQAVLSVEGSVARLRRASLPAELAAQQAPIDVIAGPDGPVDRPAAVGPYRPRPREMPLPTGDAFARIGQLTATAGGAATSRAAAVILDPPAAAAKIVDALRSWGYLEGAAT